MAPFHLEMAEPGVLDDLALRPMVRRSPGPDEVEIAVRAVGLNLREVLKALGVYPGQDEAADKPLSFDGDVVGRVVARGGQVNSLAVGDDVLGFGGDVFASHATLPCWRVVKKPAAWSDAEAATVPLAFLTAHYALRRLARLRPGERVLIHAAAGGVGLAAVQMCRQAGAEIFATAGTPEKRAYLTQLGVAHVMDSRSLEFAECIPRLTDGRGVDVVLNSLAGEFLSRSLDVLAPFGRFLEIGKRDIYEHRPLDLYALRHNRSFFAIDLEQLEGASVAALLGEIMTSFRERSLEPLPHTVFPIAEVADAFRFMRGARHIGKIVVSLTA